jgi:hypothetical protein
MNKKVSTMVRLAGVGPAVGLMAVAQTAAAAPAAPKSGKVVTHEAAAANPSCAGSIYARTTGPSESMHFWWHPYPSIGPSIFCIGTVDGKFLHHSSLGWEFRVKLWGMSGGHTSRLDYSKYIGGTLHKPCGLMVECAYSTSITYVDTVRKQYGALFGTSYMVCGAFVGTGSNNNGEITKPMCVVIYGS